MRLPFPDLSTQWRWADEYPEAEGKIAAAFRAAVERASWIPKVVRLPNDCAAVDMAVHGGRIKVNVAHLVDDPALGELPKNAPRAVKAIYRKENKLKYLRAGDAWVLHFDLKAASEAWERYQYDNRQLRHT